MVVSESQGTSWILLVEQSAVREEMLVAGALLAKIKAATFAAQPSRDVIRLHHHRTRRQTSRINGDGSSQGILSWGEGKDVGRGPRSCRSRMLERHPVPLALRERKAAMPVTWTLLLESIVRPLPSA